MYIRVLGSAAGGGFPQWNCGCPNCAGVRSGSIAASPRTQESVAVSRDGRSWFLLNASPEIRQQIEGFASLHPRSSRDTPISGILVTNGDLDHCLGLLCLREWQRFSVYATARVRDGFARSVFAKTLSRFDGQVTWRALEPGREEPLLLSSGEPSGLDVLAVAVPGKAPLHLADMGSSPEDNIALRIRDRERGVTLAYLPAAAGLSDGVTEVVRGADAVFLDGTFWSSDELVRLGASDKRAEDMAHWPIGGDTGSLAWLAGLAARHRVFIHINNTNPMLRDDSPERAAVEQAGVAVAFDGMELTL
ncbi:MAG TPA: pyrroloquinoline quinone biosynthesis protein PqqB [Polyangiaceae bacterium]|nr:pyrroloquinoline quinone biosynthesis protein PqqB [Polyangiaceae bacterium]